MGTPNPQGDAANANPQQEGTAGQQVNQAAPQVDLETRYKQSSQEALRLKKERDEYEVQVASLKDKAERWDKAEPIITKIASNQKIIAAIEEADQEESQSAPAKAPMQVFEPILHDRLEKRVKPLEDKLDQLTRGTLENRIEGFWTAHPGYKDKFDDEAAKYFKALTKEGFSVEDALDKSVQLKTINDAKSAGKREALIELYQANQAVESGGGDSAPSGGFTPALSAEEDKVARGFGMTAEEYRKWKGK